MAGLKEVLGVKPFPKKTPVPREMMNGGGIFQFGKTPVHSWRHYQLLTEVLR